MKHFIAILKRFFFGGLELGTKNYKRASGRMFVVIQQKRVEILEKTIVCSFCISY